MTEKLSPISRALVAASRMQAPDARSVLMLICEAGMRMDKPVEQTPTEGEIHYAKREKFIKRMKSSTDRVLNYARHETLRKIEKHFRANPPISSAEGDPPESLAARLTFDRSAFGAELLAALREDQESALGTAGQQLFDEIGKDSVWRLPSQDAIQFIDDRANLLANVPDEVHAEIMQSIEQGLQNGESRKELMARISTAFDEIGKGRAETIANTETAAAFNYSRDKAMREAGVTHKKWLHSMSPLIKEPRPTHLEADGQVQLIDEPFDVGGVQFMRPADDSLGAGPEDIINCHCVAIPVEAPIQSAGDKEGHPFRGNQYVSGEFSGVVYHGSPSEFESFDLAKAGTNNDTGMWGTGFYFSPSRNTALSYGKNIHRVHLTLKNPLVIHGNISAIPKELQPSLPTHGEAGRMNSHALRKRILDAGYDGVIQYESGEKKRLFQIVAFHPSQIEKT